MEHTALLFDSPALAPATPQRARRLAAARAAQAPGFDATAFEIGWDFGHHRLTPPLAHLHADNPVRQGWQAGRAAFGERALRATPHVVQWLHLRLQAWQHGQAFEEVQVTPNLLRQIAVAACPITGLALTHDSGAPSDAVVVRVCASAAYAAGNLALVSARASQAQGDLGCADALDIARRLEADATMRVDGLDSAEWARLALLMSFVTPLPHAQAAALPLLLLPPNRLRVRNPVQALQVMLTLQFTQSGTARRLVELAALLPAGEPRQAFQVFMHTLLARRLAAGPGLDVPSTRRALVQAWSDPLVNRRWQRLALRLDAADCERLVHRAARAGLVAGGVHWISATAATEGWALACARRHVGAETAACAGVELRPAPRRGLPTGSALRAGLDPASSAVQRGAAPATDASSAMRPTAPSAALTH